MDGYVTVYKGTVETKILKRNIALYEKNGWKVVEAQKQEKPKTYDKYTVMQLKSICKNRNIVVKQSDRKQDLIDMLLHQDTLLVKTETKPSNKGFTDNLIIE